MPDVSPKAPPTKQPEPSSPPANARQKPAQPEPAAGPARLPRLGKSQVKRLQLRAPLLCKRMNAAPFAIHEGSLRTPVRMKSPMELRRN